MSDEQKRTAKCSCGEVIHKIPETELWANESGMLHSYCDNDHFHTPEPPSEKACPYCGPECYGGAAHNARAEDGVLFGDLPSEKVQPPKYVVVPNPYLSHYTTAEMKYPPEPQQVIPEEWRDLYDLAKCGAFATLNKKIVSAIERLGAAEQRAGQVERRLGDSARMEWERLDKTNKELAEYAQHLEAERDRLKNQFAVSEQLRFAAEHEIDDALDAIVAGEEKRDDVLSHQVRAKVAELEGKLAELQGLLDGRGDALAAHDAKIRKETLKEAIAELERLGRPVNCSRAIRALIGGGA